MPSPNSRRILFVHPHLEVGGAERETASVAARLLDRGWDTSIALFKAKGQVLDQLDRALPVHDLKLEQHALGLITAVRLRRLINDLRPAVVISKLWSSHLVTYLARSMPGWGFSLVCFECLNPMEHVDYIPLGRLKRAIIKRVYRSSDLVLCNTRATVEAAKSIYGEALPYHVLSPGVNLAIRSSRQECQVDDPGRPRRLITVGSLIRRKGHHILVEALARVADLSWTWEILGDGPERERLWRLIAHHDLSDRVWFAGIADPLPFLAEADLLIHGASSEAFGLVIVEALGAGVPVIAADATGPAEILEKGGGWLFPRNEAEKAAKLLRVAISDPSRLPSPRECRGVAKRYSIDRITDRLEFLMNALVETHHG